MLLLGAIASAFIAPQLYLLFFENMQAGEAYYLDAVLLSKTKTVSLFSMYLGLIIFGFLTKELKRHLVKQNPA